MTFLLLALAASTGAVAVPDAAPGTSAPRDWKAEAGRAPAINIQQSDEVPLRAPKPKSAPPQTRAAPREAPPLKKSISAPTRGAKRVPAAPKAAPPPRMSRLSSVERLGGEVRREALQAFIAVVGCALVGLAVGTLWRETVFCVLAFACLGGCAALGYPELRLWLAASTQHAVYLFLTLSAAGAFNCCVVCFLIAEGVFLEEDDAEEKVRKSRGFSRLSLFFSDQRRSSNVGELPSPRGSPRRDMWNWRESRQDTRGTDDIVELFHEADEMDQHGDKNPHRSKDLAMLHSKLAGTSESIDILSTTIAGIAEENRRQFQSIMETVTAKLDQKEDKAGPAAIRS